MPSRSKPTVLALASAVLLAALPATAHASRYLSRSAASKVTKRFALRYVEERYSANKASCWPTGRRHTSRNLRSRWSRWDCSWSIRVHDDPNGSVKRCTGKIRLVGKRHGAKRRTLRNARCAKVSGPTDGNSDTPAPAPTPGPGPGPSPGTHSSRQQQMIDYAVADAAAYGNALMQGNSFAPNLVYWWHIDPGECAWLNQTKVRCPLYLWWEAHDTDTDFHPQVTREIFRSNVFVEDLGTSVGFNRNIEPQGVLAFDPAAPYYMICSNRYIGVVVCPPDRSPVIYPPGGPPYLPH